MFNKAISEISWQDLIGFWRSDKDSHPKYDLTILDKGSYLFTNMKTKETIEGSLTSSYLEKSNTVMLHLENMGDIELWGLQNNGIDLIIEDVRCKFVKL